MNPHGNGKNEPTDPDQSPFRSFRLASFIFLFAVIAGIILAFYYVFYSGGLDELRSRKESQPSAASSSPIP
jgi:hypothetical protein